MRALKLAATALPLVTASYQLPLQAAEPVSFRREIAPLLLKNCVACHGPKKAEGGYRVDSYARATSEGDSFMPGFVAGDVQSSEAFRRMTSEDAQERMPLDREPLPPETLAIFQRWIEQGAAFDAEEPEAPLASIIPPPTHPDPPAQYPHTLPITALAFSPDGKQLLASGYHEVTLWHPETGSLLSRITNLPQRVYAVAFNPQGQLLAVGGGNPGRLGEVRLLDANSGQLRQVISSTSDVILDMAFAPQGELLATAGADTIIRIFKTDSWEEVQQLTSHSDWVMDVAWSADGSRLASAGRDKSVKVFDIASGELVVTYAEHTEPVQGVAFHPEGKEIFSAGVDKKIHRWKLEDAKKSAEWQLGGEVYELEIGGQFLFAPSADKTVRQYNAATHDEIRSYAEHQDWVLSTAYDTTHRRLATGSFDGQVRVFNADDGSLIASFLAIPAAVEE